jgi:hypothetical protein
VEVTGRTPKARCRPQVFLRRCRDFTVWDTIFGVNRVAQAFGIGLADQLKHDAKVI